jgi:hypothetical protein
MAQKARFGAMLRAFLAAAWFSLKRSCGSTEIAVRGTCQPWPRLAFTVRMKTQIQIDTTTRRPRSAGTLEAAIVALACALLTFVVLRRGIGVSPDGWMYWQASVSLLTGEGFRDLLGQPVLEWPPGFPLYLAAWQALLGVSGHTLVIATVSAVAAAGFLWTLFLFRVMAPECSRVTWAALLWLVCVLATVHSFLLSEALFHALLPGVLLLSHHAFTRREPRALLVSAAGLGAALAALLLVRNATLVLIPALLLPLIFRSPVALRWRVAGAGLATLVAGGATLATRAWLDQHSSHEIGWGIGYLSASEYANHIVAGLASHLGDGALGLLLLAAIALALAAARANALGLAPETLESVRRWSLVACIACFGLFVLFNVARIGNPPRGRFTLFAMLIVVPLLLTLLQQLPRRSLGLALALLLLFAPVNRFVWLARRAAVPAELVLDARPVPRAVGHAVMLSPACIDGLQPSGDGWYMGAPSRSQLGFQEILPDAAGAYASRTP